MDMSNEAANDNFYLKDGRNLADPRFLKCNPSNHLQDRWQRKKRTRSFYWRNCRMDRLYLPLRTCVLVGNNWSENKKAAQFTMRLRGPAEYILGDLKRDQLIWPRDSIRRTQNCLSMRVSEPETTIRRDGSRLWLRFKKAHNPRIFDSNHFISREY